MASNFKIFIHKSSESLHLKLMGDFDGSSAYELLNTIEVHRTRMNRIFIHTSGLRDIFPFGKTVFQNNFSSVNNLFTGVIFTGDHADQLAPAQVLLKEQKMMIGEHKAHSNTTEESVYHNIGTGKPA
jgi:hypothetical protein